MSVNAGADAATITLRSSRLSASTRSSTSTPSMPSWQCNIRKLLRNLSKTSLTDAQLSGLHVSFQEEDESSIRPSLETSLAIDAFFATSTYQASIHCLPRDFQTRPQTSGHCSERIESMFSCWARDLGYQQSENRVKFQRAPSALRITGDTHTEGIKPAMTGRDIENGQSMSVIIRNRRRHELQLSSTELYTLLALADEQRLSGHVANSHKVHMTLDPTTVSAAPFIVNQLDD